MVREKGREKCAHAVGGRELGDCKRRDAPYGARCGGLGLGMGREEETGQKQRFPHSRPSQCWPPSRRQDKRLQLNLDKLLSDYL